MPPLRLQHVGVLRHVAGGDGRADEIPGHGLVLDLCHGNGDDPDNLAGVAVDQIAADDPPIEHSDAIDSSSQSASRPSRSMLGIPLTLCTLRQVHVLLSRAKNLRSCAKGKTTAHHPADAAAGSALTITLKGHESSPKPKILSGGDATADALRVGGSQGAGQKCCGRHVESPIPKSAIDTTPLFLRSWASLLTSTPSPNCCEH